MRDDTDKDKHAAAMWQRMTDAHASRFLKQAGSARMQSRTRSASPSLAKSSMFFRCLLCSVCALSRRSCEVQVGNKCHK